MEREWCRVAVLFEDVIGSVKLRTYSVVRDNQILVT
jgi:hypothetical protein